MWNQYNLVFGQIWIALTINKMNMHCPHIMITEQELQWTYSNMVSKNWLLVLKRHDWLIRPWQGTQKINLQILLLHLNRKLLVFCKLLHWDWNLFKKKITYCMWVWEFTIGIPKALRSSSVMCKRAVISTCRRSGS